MTDRRDPTWSSPNEVVWETPIARLRDFSTSSTQAANFPPSLLLPPQAGHDSCIVDYPDPLQSQVRTALDSPGLTRVLYHLDWIGATAETKDASIEDYVAVVGEAIRAGRWPRRPSGR